MYMIEALRQLLMRVRDDESGVKQPFFCNLAESDLRSNSPVV